jgi:hypothetical protein
MTTHFDAVLARMTTFVRSLPDLEGAAEKAWAHALYYGWISSAVFRSYRLHVTERDGELHLELDTKFQTVVFEEAIEIEGDATPEPWLADCTGCIYEGQIPEDCEPKEGERGYQIGRMYCDADAEFVDHARMYYAPMARMLKRILAEAPSPEIVEIMRSEFERMDTP